MDPTVGGDVVSVLSVVPTGAVGAARLPQFEEPCVLEALVGPHPSVGRERVAYPGPRAAFATGGPGWPQGGPEAAWTGLDRLILASYPDVFRLRGNKY